MGTFASGRRHWPGRHVSHGGIDLVQASRSRAHDGHSHEGSGEKRDGSGSGRNRQESRHPAKFRSARRPQEPMMTSLRYLQLLEGHPLSARQRRRLCLVFFPCSRRRPWHLLFPTLEILISSYPLEENRGLDQNGETAVGDPQCCRWLLNGRLFVFFFLSLKL